MTTLLTGANGFVGSRIRMLTSVTAAPSLRNASRDDIRRMVDAVQPDVIIHTAAISDIGTCEKNPEASFHANVMIPIYLAEAAGHAKIIMYSTDQVYSGCASEGPYQEDDVCPANLYARHKLDMEQRVLAISPDAVMLRATWMYDMPVYGLANRGNFLMNMLRAAATQSPLAFPDTQYRGITYVREAAQHTLQAVNLPGGVYNFGSENTLSMQETARFLADALNLRIDISTAPPRHNLWMDGEKLRRHGIAFRSTTEGLLACMDDYQLK